MGTAQIRIKVLCQSNYNFNNVSRSIKCQYKEDWLYFLRDVKNTVMHHCHLKARGGSNEYPQSMFLSRNNKNNVYPCKPQFYYIKVGFKRVKII